MCAIIESAQSSFCTMTMDWKVAVLKIQLACLCFADGLLGNPTLTSEVLFLYTVLLNIERCIRFTEKLLFDLLLFFSRVGYMTIGITSYQKPR